MDVSEISLNDTLSENSMSMINRSLDPAYSKASALYSENNLSTSFRVSGLFFSTRCITKLSPNSLPITTASTVFDSLNKLLITWVLKSMSFDTSSSCMANCLPVAGALSIMLLSATARFTPNLDSSEISLLLSASNFVIALPIGESFAFSLSLESVPFSVLRISSFCFSNLFSCFFISLAFFFSSLCCAFSDDSIFSFIASKDCPNGPILSAILLSFSFTFSVSFARPSVPSSKRVL